MEKFKCASHPIVVDQNAFLQGWKCFRSAVWKLRHWRATASRSMRAPFSQARHRCLLVTTKHTTCVRHRPSLVRLLVRHQRSAHPLSATVRKALSFPTVQQRTDAPWSCAVWDARGFVGCGAETHARGTARMGALGSWMSGREAQRGRDHRPAAMSEERAESCKEFF